MTGQNSLFHEFCQSEMQLASQNLQFEEAAKLRDEIKRLKTK